MLRLSHYFQGCPPYVVNFDVSSIEKKKEPAISLTPLFNQSAERNLHVYTKKKSEKLRSTGGEIVSKKPSWLVAAVQKYINDFVRRFGYNPSTSTKRYSWYLLKG